MPEELKCPCCGERTRTETYGRVMCGSCSFVCDIKSFPRITAAMELAMAIVKHESELTNENDKYGDYAEIAARHVADMESRLLEVFK